MLPIWIHFLTKQHLNRSVKTEINSIIRSLVRAEMGNKEDQSVALSPVAIPARKRINFELYEPIEEYSYDKPKSDLIETTIYEICS